MATLGPRRRSIQGFTLVEISLALGIFAFVIVGIVFLLGTALQSSTDTERDSALSAALITTASLIRSYDNTALPNAFYFDAQGSPVPTVTGGTTPDLTKAYYQFTITNLGTAGSLPNQQMYSVKVTAPYPSQAAVGTYLVSHH